MPAEQKNLKDAAAAQEVQETEKEKGTEPEAVVVEPAVAILVPILKPKNLKMKKKAAAKPAPEIVEIPNTEPSAAKEKKKPAVIAMLPKLPPSIFHVPPRTAHRLPDDALSGEACHAALRKFRVDYDMQATLVSSGDCSVTDAVMLKSMTIGKNTLSFPDRPTLTCGFAARLAAWIVEEGSPAVENSANTRIRAIGTGPGYQCRGRNGDSSGKLSEHAFGNAVDIEYFKLADGQTVQVQDAVTIGAKHQPVLAILRATGCRYFMTVLGPGANSAHASHFHFDLERRGRTGKSKLCQ